jgi:large subunit ribosomal protein L17
MRHKNYKYKLGTSPAHRKSLLRNLSLSMLKHGKIKTTLTKCKALRPFLEKMVTRARVDSVHNRREIYSILGEREIVKKLFTEVAPKFVQRPGGYTRIVKVADGRVGDGAKLGYLMFVE